MNDFPAPIIFAADPNLVQMVENVLAQIKEGQVTTVGFVFVNSLGQIGCGSGGPRGGDVYVGCDMLKANLMAAFTGQKSPIMRAM